MEQEDKKLLLQDLCARLPYGVICQYNCVIPCGRITLEKTNERDVLKGIIPMSDGHIGFMVGIDKVNALEGDIRPYLRPMDSMTEEEENELRRIRWTTKEGEPRMYEWCDYANAHHLDYRGLIEKNLALDCTGLHIYD